MSPPSLQAAFASPIRGPAGLRRTDADDDAQGERWFAADVTLNLAVAPIHPLERGVAALSRAAGPVALALAVLVPVAALLR